MYAIGRKLTSTVGGGLASGWGARHALQGELERHCAFTGSERADRGRDVQIVAIWIPIMVRRSASIRALQTAGGALTLVP